MPLEELAGGFLGGLFRLVGYFFMHIVFELLLKRTGYFIRRFFSRSVNTQSEGTALVGLGFWLVVAALVYWFFWSSQ